MCTCQGKLGLPAASEQLFKNKNLGSSWYSTFAKNTEGQFLKVIVIPLSRIFAVFLKKLYAGRYVSCTEWEKSDGDSVAMMARSLSSTRMVFLKNARTSFAVLLVANLLKTNAYMNVFLFMYNDSIFLKRTFKHP